MSTFGEMTTPKARKDHRCEWCYGLIPKGEVHYRFSGIFDSEFQCWRAHNECYLEMERDPETLVEGFLPGEGEKPERVKELEKRLALTVMEAANDQKDN